MKKIIGISGLARSGKDLFTTVAQTILKENNITSERYALAYELKNDLKNLIKKQTGIDVFTENTAEKNTIRPILVAYGDVMRKISEGKYWTGLLENRIASSKADVIFVTDIRYDVYPEDECYWLKNKQNGKLIHITKFLMGPAPSKRRVSSSKIVKIYNGAPNEHEMFNNPKVKAKADYAFEWEDFSDKLDGNKLEDHPYIRDQVKKALMHISILS